MRYVAYLWLFCLGLLFAATAARFLPTPPIETDLLALLPATERNPRAEEATARLGRLTGERAVFLLGLPRGEDARAAAESLAAHLQSGRVFKRVVTRVPSPDPGALLDLYGPHRTGLAAPATNYSALLGARLSGPFGGGALPLDQDPFGLMDAWIGQLPFKQFRLDLEEGWLTARAEGRVWVLVSGELAGSAFDPTLQARLKEALAAAEAQLKQRWPDLQLPRAGAVFHASAARETAQAEMHVIGLGSLIGIVLLLVLAYRSPAPLVLGLLSVSAGLAAASLTTTLVFGRLHLMTLVFGASLIGEAVDYAIQYFSARLGAGSTWNAEAGRRAVFPALALALATSVAGYAALGLTPFPALRQIAVFAIAGLAAAWLTTLLVLPAFLNRPSRPAPEWLLRLPARWLDFWRRRIGARVFLIVSGVLLAVSTLGWTRLSSDDDVRQLIQRESSLAAQEEKLRGITGLEAGSQFFLIEADNVEQALRREEVLRERLEAAGLSLTGVSSFVPSCQRQHAIRSRLRTDQSAQRDALAEFDFRPQAVANWEHILAEEQACLTPAVWLASPISTPFRHLWLGSSSDAALVALPSGYRQVNELEQVVANLEGITLVDKPGAVSLLFGEYRRLTGFVIAAATVLIFLVLAWRHGARGGFAMLLPTLLAQALTLGLLGLLGISLNLFNMLALLLVLGVGINYAIFQVESVHGGTGREAAALLGVILSALTTLLSFGLLGLSSMPALAGFGLTLSLGIAISVLLAPSALLVTDKSR